MKAKYFLILNDKMKLANSIKKNIFRSFPLSLSALSMFLSLSLLYTSLIISSYADGEWTHSYAHARQGLYHETIPPPIP